MKPKLSIIIPAYNEEMRISKTLDYYSDFLNKKRINYEIIVIMDGITDKTKDIVEIKMKDNKRIGYKEYTYRQGKGGALLKGFSMASGEYTAYIDADCSTPPEEIVKLIESIGSYDGIVGSRWLKSSEVKNMQPLLRRVASRSFNILTRIILRLPYKDTQCPAKVFRSEIIKYILNDIKVTDFAFDAVLLYFINKKGFKIKEIPIIWSDKPMSSLKIGRATIRMFYSILKTRFRG